MLDKRKLIVLLIAAVAALAIIAALVIYAVRSAQSSDGDPGTATVSPTSTGDPQAAATEAFEQHEQTARDAAVAACSWRMLATDAIAETQYINAGFAPTLASSYTPVWQQLFDSDTVASAEINCDVAEPPSINAVTGSPGEYIWQVSVRLTYGGVYVEDATPGAVPTGHATWTLTIEEVTGEITAVTQPDPSQLTIPTERP